MCKKTIPGKLVIALIVSVLLPFIAGCPGTLKDKEPPKTEQEQPKEKEKPKEQPKPAETAKKPGDYFPLTKGSTWEYQGEGNEYASFKREVLLSKDNRAQIKEDSGGTVSGIVFETTDNAVIRIFSQGENYDNENFLTREPNENTVILKAPLQVGTKWANPGGDREIVDINATVDTPAGKFEQCIKVKIPGKDSTTYEFYKEGVGLIKREFLTGPDKISSTLEKYEIKK